MRDYAYAAVPDSAHFTVGRPVLDLHYAKRTPSGRSQTSPTDLKPYFNSKIRPSSDRTRARAQHGRQLADCRNASLNQWADSLSERNAALPGVRIAGSVRNRPFAAKAMTTSPGYTLRVSVRTLGKTPVAGLETEPTIDVGPIHVTVKQRGRFLVFSAGDFASETDAEAFLPRLKGGLWNLAIEHNIAFIPFFERRDITRPEDPYAAARNLAKNFGQTVEEPVQPVHGLTEEEGYVIFRSDENIRFLGLGDMTAHVSTGWAHVKGTLAAGIEQVRGFTDEADANLATAIDLYLSSFYESSIRARFLTLVMALEVLAPVIEKHSAAVQLLIDLQKAIDTRLVGETNPEARDALQALRRETDFRKETSIRRRIRHLVLQEVPLCDIDREALARRVVAAYDLRGSVIHKGAVNPHALAEANETVLQTVKLLLRSRLGLAAVPAQS